MREAHVRLDESGFDAMGIEELVSLFRSAGIRDFEELVCRGDGAIVQVAVQDRVEESALSALSCVDQWERVAGSGASGAHVYVLEFTAPDLPETLVRESEDLLGTCDPEVGDDGVTLSLVGPQDAIAGTVDDYAATGVTPDVRKLSGYDGGDRPLDALTDRQREVLRVAHDLGHYEVPREASTEDVAAELDVDASTVAEHLQRAERNLIGQHL